MTILQGTMQDGTVIPVQVDAQGRLVAEGLQGPPGPAGPKGDPGQLPPNPVEGAVLAWENGQLVWSTTAGGGSVYPLSVLVVAGGGGGERAGAAGGGGGVVHTGLDPVAGTWTVTVGGGGSANTNGTNSEVLGRAALGGGGANKAGGCGGGRFDMGSGFRAPMAGFQGWPGGAAVDWGRSSGGGGSTGPGLFVTGPTSSTSAGGPGLNLKDLGLTTTDSWVAAGGGAGSDGSTYASAGGSPGAGDGGNYAVAATSAAANTGSGGGGGGNGVGGSGGSGIVYIWHETSLPQTITGSGGGYSVTTATVKGKECKIHKFTATGTLTIS